MQLRRLPADEAAVRRYVEELWLPYNRDLEAVVDRHALAVDVDIVDEEVAFRLDNLEDDENRVWIAVDDVREEGASLADVDGEFVGFVTTTVDEASPVFDRPNRLVIGDVYVREDYRGTGLADDLFDRAAERAREVGCVEFALDVDNGRAMAFYEKRGFETVRRRMAAAVDD